MRNTKLDDIVGQDLIKARIKILLDGCEVFPHSLIVGPAGTGKSSFAFAIANHINSNCSVLHGSTINKPKDLIPQFLKLRQGDVVFIDEIHGINRKVQEFLYTAIEDFYLDIGGGLVRKKLPMFTMIGATTQEGLLEKPMLDRFSQKFVLDFYKKEDIFSLIKKQNLSISVKAAGLIYKACKGIPRKCLNLLKWIELYGQNFGIYHFRHDDVVTALSFLDIDKNGLDLQDRKYLDCLSTTCPVGLSTIVAKTGISRETIENIIEPYFVSNGILLKTSKGRLLK